MNKYYYDLHIHSCLSPCADDDMTPSNIAGMATLKGLQVLALTDHNTCDNCPAFFEACKSLGIIPIAGMELTTAEDIHMVCLFEELDVAIDFSKEVKKHIMPIENNPEIFGNQFVTDVNDEVISEEPILLISATDISVSDAIALVHSFGGHIHPAHIDRESNGMLAILGDIPSEYGFRVIEFNDKDNAELCYSRCASIKDAQTLVCSDAHHLWDISEAENFLMIDDEPYSSSLVRRKIFELLDGNNNHFD